MRVKMNAVRMARGRWVAKKPDECGNVLVFEAWRRCIMFSSDCQTKWYLIEDRLIALPGLIRANRHDEDLQAPQLWMDDQVNLLGQSHVERPAEDQ